jgi:putative thioredoxin
MLGPILESLAAKNEGVWELKKINTEIFGKEAAAYRVQSIPNVKLFVDGKVRDEFVGALPQRAIEQWLEKALPDPHEGIVAQARGVFGLSRDAEAGALLSGVLEKAPRHPEALVLSAMVMLFTDRPGAMAVVDRLPDVPVVWERAEALRTLLGALSRLDSPDTLQEAPVREPYLAAIRSLAASDFDAALAGFIEVLRTDRSYENDGSRKICIALFRLLGEDHDVVRRHRKAFDRAF